MSTVNLTKSSLAEIKIAEHEDSISHNNFMNGKSFDVTNPLTLLKMMASSCFFGEPQYYGVKKSSKSLNNYSNSAKNILKENGYVDCFSAYEGKTTSDILERVIDNALLFDAKETLEFAVKLRHEDNIRVTPQVIAVRAANAPHLKKTGLIRKYAASVIGRIDETATQLAYQLAAYPDKPIPNGLKRAWSDALLKTKEYGLAKYRLSSKEVKLVDIVNLSHPYSEPIDKLIKGTLSQSGNTWEAILSSGGTWEQAIDVMGHMALLRNIRNFCQKNVSPDLWVDKFIETAKSGKQLPFRYFSAYNAVKNEFPSNMRVLDAIESSLELSLETLPVLPGNSMTLVDNSGSAQGATTSSMGTVQVSTIGNLMGIITVKITENYGDVGIFGDNLQWLAISKKDSILRQLEHCNQIGKTIGQSTEHGVWLALDEITSKKIVYDNIFIYSDMQAGHGGLYGKNNDYSKFRWNGSRHIDVSALIKRYRNKVNPNVNVFLVQTAGYADTLVPEFYNRTYILGGWSEGILKFAHEMIELRK